MKTKRIQSWRKTKTKIRKTKSKSCLCRKKRWWQKPKSNIEAYAAKYSDDGPDEKPTESKPCRKIVKTNVPLPMPESGDDGKNLNSETRIPYFYSW